MSMVISNKRLINGVNPQIAKKICQYCRERLASLEELTELFEVTEITMMRWLLLLTEARFIDMKGKDGVMLWLCSAKGASDLAKARLGKPVPGTKFSDLVLKVIERIDMYNSESRHPFYINEACLFGAVISQPWLFDDPNIIIDIGLKPELDSVPNWRSSYYAEYCQDRNLTIVNQVLYPEHELSTFLHKQRENINIYFKESEMPDEFRLIYKRDDASASENKEMQNIMTLNEITSFGQKLESYRKSETSNKRKRHVGISLESIAEYWDDDARFKKLGISNKDAGGCCWRCGSKQDLQRCHIIPDSLGGRDEKANYVILCSRCHAEGPNISDEDIMFDWLAAYRMMHGEDYWPNAAIAEYQRIYGKSVPEEIQDILENANQSIAFDKAFAELKLLVNEATTQAIFHFGQSWYNCATVAGLYRIALRKLPSRLLQKE